MPHVIAGVARLINPLRSKAISTEKGPKNCSPLQVVVTFQFIEIFLSETKNHAILQKKSKYYKIRYSKIKLLLS